MNSRDTQPTDPLAPDAPSIEAQLFKPSPRYLLALFCHPSLARARGLQEAADWFGLDSALLRLDPSSNLHTAIDERWLELLEMCNPRLPSEADRHELDALLGAMREMSSRADDGPRLANLEALWTAMSGALRAKAGPSRAGKYDGMNPATLRGRKWHALRAELARALADVVAHVSPSSLLPRQPRKPVMFNEASYSELGKALRRESRGSGLVVLTGRPGSGRAEFALNYAHAKRDDRSYDQVFVLRASDQLRLERDFLTMARILAPGAQGRAELRREALRHLETSNRWLVVFMSVNDPVILLPFLPWTTSGHVLCTIDARATSELAAAELWLRHFNVEPLDLATVGADLDGTTAVQTLAKALPPTLRDDLRLVQIAERVSDSRYAMALVVGWLEHTALSDSSDPALVAAHASAQLDGYLAAWENALAYLGASGETKDIRAHPPAVPAALVVLMELYHPRLAGDKPKARHASLGWRSRKAVAKPALEYDALLLVARIEPFIGEGLTGSSLQAVLLDDAAYETADRIDDERLALLDRLALVERATGVATGKYFDVNAAVLTAVRELNRHVTLETTALAIASRTMIKVLPDSVVDGALPDLAFEMLPHVEALAHREASAARWHGRDSEPNGAAPPKRPIVAIELYARAALCYLTRGRTRTAGTRIADMMRVFDYLAENPVQDLEDWEGLENDKHSRLPLPPAARMARLVRALRTSGFPEPAARICGGLEELAMERGAFADVPADVARLRFEGAMALHDLNRIGQARARVEAAKEAWLELGDRRRYDMALNFEAELDFDEGDFKSARAAAERAREGRERRLSSAQRYALARPIAEVARSNFMLGRIAYVDGELGLARELFKRSVDGWGDALECAAHEASGPRFSNINLVTARSYHALMLALLGDVPAAVGEAEAVRRELKQTPHTASTAIAILSNVAQTLRVAGRVNEAAGLHAQALGAARSTWLGGNDIEPPIVRVVRRKSAESQIDAGRPSDALHELLDLVDTPGQPQSVGRVLADARVWTTFGRLLIENAVSAPPIVTSSDSAFLTLARKALEHARSLFLEVSDDSHVNPGMVGCLLGLSEIAIRRRSAEDATMAEKLAQAALELAQAQYPPGAPPLATPEARLIRARAIAAADQPERIAELRAEVDGLAARTVSVYSHVDRFEVALAQVEVRACEWDGTEAVAREILDIAHKFFFAALEPLYEAIGAAQPHQLVARTYAELAALAERFGQARHRGRNERECARLRPRLDIDVSEISLIVGARLGPVQSPTVVRSLVENLPPAGASGARRARPVETRPVLASPET